MKFNFPFRNIMLSFILTVYLCTLFGIIQFVGSNDNYSAERSKLYRQKDSANYFDYKPDSRLKNAMNKRHQFSNLPILSYRSIDLNADESKRAKPWAKKDAQSAKDNAKAEEGVDPDKPAPIQTRMPSAMSRTLEDVIKLTLPNCGTSQKNNERVVNGKNAAPGAYPWAVVILKSGDAWCGGTILNEEWVITAAHCFMSDQSPTSYAIRVGSVNRNEGTGYKIEKLILHERFHLDNMFNSDIALLKIAKKIKMGKDVNSICLPTQIYEEPTANTLTIIGWGQTSFENKDLPVMLQEVNLNRISVEECAKKYKTKGNTIYRSQICTWNKDQDACQGDSGSSATEWRNQKAFQLGVVSYGSTCADDFPGVYTKVSYFLQWIVNTIKKN